MSSRMEFTNKREMRFLCKLENRLFHDHIVFYGTYAAERAHPIDDGDVPD